MKPEDPSAGLARILEDLALRVRSYFAPPRRVIWLLGNGRSGTTWVASLINHDSRHREMFEPFHPWYVQSSSFLQPHLYLRRRERHPQLERLAQQVFSGSFHHPRVNTPASRPSFGQGIVIKDIFANLFAHWAAHRFPALKIVMLVRHPFAVALSKLKKSHWSWLKEPRDLLGQRNLLEDHLQPFAELIRKTSLQRDFILSQIVIWAITHYVPLRQFDPKQLHVVFYEDVVRAPHAEVSRILRFAEANAGPHPLRLKKRLLRRPSRYSRKQSNVLAGVSPITAWRDALPAEKVDAGLAILRAFGMDELYDDALQPNRAVLARLQGSLSR